MPVPTFRRLLRGAALAVVAPVLVSLTIVAPAEAAPGPVGQGYVTKTTSTAIRSVYGGAAQTDSRDCSRTVTMTFHWKVRQASATGVVVKQLDVYTHAPHGAKLAKIAVFGKKHAKTRAFALEGSLSDVPAGRTAKHSLVFGGQGMFIPFETASPRRVEARVNFFRTSIPRTCTTAEGTLHSFLSPR